MVAFFSLLSVRCHILANANNYSKKRIVLIRPYAAELAGTVTSNVARWSFIPTSFPFSTLFTGLLTKTANRYVVAGRPSSVSCSKPVAACSSSTFRPFEG